jgi:hypothetical protein
MYLKARFGDRDNNPTELTARPKGPDSTRGNNMRLRCGLLAIFAAAALSGCDSGIYSTTSNKDGSLIVLNRLTGTAQRVEGDTLVELHPVPPQSPTDYKPALAPRTIPKQPFSIEAKAKYRDGMMLILTVRSNGTPKSPADWTAWRSHLDQCRSSAKLHLEFMDRDGFLVVTQDAELAEMRRTVNSEGELTELVAQLVVPVTRDDYGEISYWKVGWGGVWPDYIPPPATDKAPDKGPAGNGS